MDDIKVIFSGRIRDGFDVDKVREQFSRQFKIAGPALDRIFDNDDFTLRSGLDLPTAEKLVRVLRNFGMVARWEQPAAEVDAVDLSAFLDDDLPSPEAEAEVDSEFQPEADHSLADSEADLALETEQSDDQVGGLDETPIAEPDTVNEPSSPDWSLTPIGDEADATDERPIEGIAEYVIDESDDAEAVAADDTDADTTAETQTASDDVADTGGLSLELVDEDDSGDADIDAALDDLDLDFDLEPASASEASVGELVEDAAAADDLVLEDFDAGAELDNAMPEAVADVPEVVGDISDVADLDIDSELSLDLDESELSGELDALDLEVDKGSVDVSDEIDQISSEIPDQTGAEEGAAEVVAQDTAEAELEAPQFDKGSADSKSSGKRAALGIAAAAVIGLGAAGWKYRDRLIEPGWSIDQIRAGLAQECQGTDWEAECRSGLDQNWRRCLRATGYNASEGKLRGDRAVEIRNSIDRCVYPEYFEASE